MFDGRFRKGVDRAVKPVGTALERTKLSPDHLTALGLVMSLPAGWAIATGRLWLGLVLLVVAAVPDLLDGALAKASGKSSVRGAFFDSVCDRVTDTVVLGGVAWYLQDHHHGHAFMLAFAVLGASLLISYERAKAESLGFDAKGGLMERAERVVVLCIGLLFSFLLVPVLWVMLGLTCLTAIQRFHKVWRQATAVKVAAEAEKGAAVAASEGAERPDAAAAPVAAAAPGSWTSVEATALAVRWRAWREANGWAPRSDRYTFGTRKGTASGSRWHERRQSRVARRRESDPEATIRRRSGSRRP